MAAIAVTLHGPSFSSFFRFSFLLSASHDVCVCLVSGNKPSQGDVVISCSLTSIVNTLTENYPLTINNWIDLSKLIFSNKKC